MLGWDFRIGGWAPGGDGKNEEDEKRAVGSKTTCLECAEL